MQSIQNTKKNSSEGNYFTDNNGNILKHGNLCMKYTKPENYIFLKERYKYGGKIKIFVLLFKRHTEEIYISS